MPLWRSEQWLGLCFMLTVFSIILWTKAFKYDGRWWKISYSIAVAVKILFYVYMLKVIWMYMSRCPCLFFDFSHFSPIWNVQFPLHSQTLSLLSHTINQGGLMSARCYLRDIRYHLPLFTCGSGVSPGGRNVRVAHNPPPKIPPPSWH